MPASAQVFTRLCARNRSVGCGVIQIRHRGLGGATRRQRPVLPQIKVYLRQLVLQPEAKRLGKQRQSCAAGNLVVEFHALRAIAAQPGDGHVARGADAQKIMHAHAAVHGEGEGGLHCALAALNQKAVVFHPGLQFCMYRERKLAAHGHIDRDVAQHGAEDVAGRARDLGIDAKLQDHAAVRAKRALGIAGYLGRDLADAGVEVAARRVPEAVWLRGLRKGLLCGVPVDRFAGTGRACALIDGVERNAHGVVGLHLHLNGQTVKAQLDLVAADDRNVGGNGELQLVAHQRDGVFLVLLRLNGL